MANDALTELRGLHVPPMELSAVIAEAFAALAVGLITAWLLAQIVTLMTTRRIPPEKIALKRLTEADALPETEQLAARAAILQDLAHALPEGEGDWMARLDERLDGLFTEGAGKGLRDALYKPQASFDLAGFDAALRKALSRATG